PTYSITRTNLCNLDSVGEASLVDLKKNLEYAASVLEFLYTEETRRMVDLEDELSDIPSDSVPSEVRNWLASTFTRRKGLAAGCNEDKLRFRSIVHAVQAGIFVDRMYRRSSHMAALSYPPGVVTELKQVDKWSFDVFALNDASGDHSLKFVLYELLTRYDLISRFKIPVSALISFVDSLEVGYSKHKNPYHNLIHAADVTQTIHYLLLKTGMLHWLSELEIFATIFAAAIHDYEHTGTTNNFHVQTRSDISLLYNDHAVLENHHVSAVYRLLQNNDEVNILSNLSKDDWRELRSLVVEMVLATDMSCHFEQIKVMKSLLQQPDAIDKAKALSLLLHTADISHPAKPWSLHHRWTFSLLEEFFRQGDKEAELGLPFSPLCDRKSTMVAQSQIGFIDFIVEPTFTVMTEMIEKIMTPLMEEACLLGLDGFRRSSVNSISCSDGKSTKSDGSCSLASVDFNSFKATWIREVHQNKETWRSQAAKGNSTNSFLSITYSNVTILPLFWTRIHILKHKLKTREIYKKITEGKTGERRRSQGSRIRYKSHNCQSVSCRPTGSQLGHLWMCVCFYMIPATNTYPQGGTESEDQEMDHPISGVEVAEVVKQLPGGGAPGADVILPGYLKALDVVMLSWLTRLCNIAWTSGAVPLDWQTGVVVPIFKSGEGVFQL
uniref:Phosphodiesterase n=1 Tax=Takifugu rubripes TaxID=31033 RepID=A0A674NNR2_TAKRU